MGNMHRLKGMLSKNWAAFRDGIAAISLVYYRALAWVLPNDLRIHLQVSRLLMQQKYWSEATEICKDLLQQRPDFAEAQYVLGQVYLGQGYWQEAVQALHQAIEIDGTFPEFYYTLGQIQRTRENWEDAISAFRKAILINSRNTWIHHDLGETLLTAGYWLEAISTLQVATKLKPFSPWSYCQLGNALLAMDRRKESISAYKSAFRLSPYNHYFKQCIEYAQNLDRQDQKIATYCRQWQPNSDRLSLLMIMPFMPYPPITGGMVRLFNELKYLGEKHRVVLLVLMFSKGDICYEAELEKYCDLALLVANGDHSIRQQDEPRSINRYSSQRMRDVLGRLETVRFDIVSHNLIYAAQYLDVFPDALHVLAELNIESELLVRSTENKCSPEQLKSLAEQSVGAKFFLEAKTEAVLLARYEKHVWDKFPLRTAVSDRDKEIIDQYCSLGTTIVVNNGVDTKAVTLVTRSEHKRILFIGSMTHYPNIDAAFYFVEEILSIIRQQDPETQFWIAGSSPPQKITELAKEASVTIIADPKDMSSVAQECCVSVAPIRFGSGTRIKILHSMAMGLPVISTSLGCEGLRVTDGEHLLIRDEPAEFAQAVLSLIADPKLQETLRCNGRCLVEEIYDWGAIYSKAEREYVRHFWAWKQQ